MVRQVPSHGTDSHTIRGQVQLQDSTAAAHHHAIFNHVQHSLTWLLTDADRYPPFSNLLTFLCPPTPPLTATPTCRNMIRDRECHRFLWGMGQGSGFHTPDKPVVVHIV